MSYTPTEWKSGDVVTSAKLNNIEQGIVDASSGGGGGSVVVIPTTGVYDDETELVDSYASISADAVPDALAAGKIPEILVTFNIDDGEGTVLGTFKVSFRFVREKYTVNGSGATEITRYDFLSGILESHLAGVTVGTDGSITTAN